MGLPSSWSEYNSSRGRQTTNNKHHEHVRWTLSENAPGRGISQCKGPKVEVYMVCSRISKEVGKLEQGLGERVRDEVRERMGSGAPALRLCRQL